MTLQPVSWWETCSRMNASLLYRFNISVFSIFSELFPKTSKQFLNFSSTQHVSALVLLTCDIEHFIGSAVSCFRDKLQILRLSYHHNNTNITSDKPDPYSAFFCSAYLGLGDREDASLRRHHQSYVRPTGRM